MATMRSAARVFTIEIMKLRAELLDLVDDANVRRYLIEAQRYLHAPDTSLSHLDRKISKRVE